jgi:hypothetical protein
MNRRQGVSTRPASSEGTGIFTRSLLILMYIPFTLSFLPLEVDTWARAAVSLNALSEKYCGQNTLDIIDRVNRLIAQWPHDDTMPAEGWEGIRSVHKKLEPNLQRLQSISDEEIRYILYGVKAFFM